MRTLAAAVIVAGAVLLAAPAQAGGPTSVLITDMESGDATALYYTDSDYAELERLLQSGERIARPPAGAISGSPYNVTWLVHDVSVWRTDTVFLGGQGDPYVKSSLIDWDSGEFSRETWLRIKQGEDLRQFLDEAFAATSAAGPTAPGPAPVPAPAAAPEVVERVVTETRTSWYALDGWRWLLPGLAAGLLAGRVLGRRRGDDEEPRRLLVDRAPEDAVV